MVCSSVGVIYRHLGVLLTRSCQRKCMKRRRRSYVACLSGLVGLGAIFMAVLTSPARADTGVPAPVGATGRDYTFTFVHDGIDRSYRVFVPTAVAADPGVLVFLHGSGGFTIKGE